jgi:hypothetical protein
MSVSIQDFDLGRLSFGDRIEGDHKNRRCAYHNISYDGQPFFLICKNVRSSEGIRNSRTLNGPVSFCMFNMEEDLSSVMAAVYERVRDIYPYCRNPVYDNNLFYCKINSNLTYPPNTAFSGTVCIKIRDVFLSNNRCEIRCYIESLKPEEDYAIIV